MAPRKSDNTDMSLMGRVVATFNRIGTSGDPTTNIPRANDPRDRAVMELAIANTLMSLAEKRKEAARNEVRRLFRDDVDTLTEGNPAVGVYSTRYCSLSAQMTRGRTMLDRGLLVQMLLKNVKGMTLAKAEAWVDQGTKTSAGSLKLDPMIANVD